MENKFKIKYRVTNNNNKTGLYIYKDIEGPPNRVQFKAHPLSKQYKKGEKQNPKGPTKYKTNKRKGNNKGVDKRCGIWIP